MSTPEAPRYEKVVSRTVEQTGPSNLLVTFRPVNQHVLMYADNEMRTEFAIFVSGSEDKFVPDGADCCNCPLFSRTSANVGANSSPWSSQLSCTGLRLDKKYRYSSAHLTGASETLAKAPPSLPCTPSTSVFGGSSSQDLKRVFDRVAQDNIPAASPVQKSLLDPNSEYGLATPVNSSDSI